MPPSAHRSPEHLRVGDADRDAAVTALGDHYAAGRLTADEHDERMGRAWAARTYGDLVAIFADLPGPVPDPPGSTITRAGVPAPAPPAAAAPHPTAPAEPEHGWPLSGHTTVLLVLGTVAVVLSVTVPGTPWPLFIFLWWCFGGFRSSSYRRLRRGRSHGPPARR